MRADPAVLYAKPAQRRCKQICDEIVDILRADPEPRVTGELLSSYRTVDRPPGAEIVTDVRYWHFVEFGTSKMEAKPHIRPAVEIVRRRYRS